MRNWRYYFNNLLKEKEMRHKSSKIMMFVLMGVLCLSVSSVYAETIVLKSGKTVEGKLIEKTDKYIKIDFQGVPLTYSLSEIQSVDGKVIGLLEEEKVDIGRPPASFKPAEKTIQKNDSDDVWEMTIKGIEPMYDDPDPRRGKSQKELDETLIKLIISQMGSREAAVAERVASAQIYFNSGYPNIAMRKFNQAWLLDPKNAKVYYGFGCILSSRKEFDGAIKMYTEAIELDPEYYEAYANRGLDYFNKQALDKAILDFKKEIEIRPNEGQTYNDRAVAYFFREEYDKVWLGVHKAETLGYAVNPEFIAEIKKASGRDK